MNELIIDLERDIEIKADYILAIKRPNMLLSALKDLNNMIGNTELKNDVATQVEDLIDSLNNKDNEEPIMLHTLLYGGPGVGKSEIGKHLARIWYALGYIGNNKEIKRNYHSSTDTKKAKKSDWSDIINGLTSEDMDKFQSSYATIMMIVALISIILAILGYFWSMARGAANFVYNTFGFKWGIIIAAFLLVIFIIVFWIWINTNYDICKKCLQEKCICKQLKKVAVKEEEVKISIRDNFEVKDEDLIDIVSAEDFIGQYVGWTEKQTTALLQKSKGKVLFIDEAYSLVSSSGIGDSYGEKALNIINRYMSEHPEELVIIMAGYEHKIKNNLFSVQPGLARRFMWSFNCKGYNIEELFEIWKQQMKPRTIMDEPKTIEIFRKNRNIFPNFAGDTLRLVNFVKLEQKRDNRKRRGPNLGIESSIIEAVTPDQVERAIKVLIRNTFRDKENDKQTITPEMLNLLQSITGR